MADNEAEGAANQRKESPPPDDARPNNLGASNPEPYSDRGNRSVRGIKRFLP